MLRAGPLVDEDALLAGLLVGQIDGPEALGCHERRGASGVGLGIDRVSGVPPARGDELLDSVDVERQPPRVARPRPTTILYSATITSRQSPRFRRAETRSARTTLLSPSRQGSCPDCSGLGGAAGSRRIPRAETQDWLAVDAMGVMAVWARQPRAIPEHAVCKRPERGRGKRRPGRVQSSQSSSRSRAGVYSSVT